MPATVPAVGGRVRRSLCNFETAPDRVTKITQNHVVIVSDIQV